MSTAVIPDPAEVTTDAGTGAPDAAALAAAAQAEAEKGAPDPAIIAGPVKPVVPEKYDLKAPDGVTLDAAFTDRTAAIARELGLDQDAAQRLHTERITEATNATKAHQALVDAWKPGGAEWTKRDAEWTTKAKSDPELGKTPEEFAATVEKGQQALAKFGSPELKQLLTETGFGSHPAAVKFLANIGRAMSEPSMVLGGLGGSKGAKTDAQVMFPSLYNDDGTPKT